MTKDKKRFWLSISVERAHEPIIWLMSRKFKLTFNIRDAQVTAALGLIALELEGPNATIERAVRWFKRQGVRVDPVELSVIEG